MKKLFKFILTMVTIVAILSPIGFCADMDFKSQIKSEDGSLFEKIIAECIGGIAQTVFNFTTSETANVGFKDYDTLIFNKDSSNDSLSPFTQELWNKTMNWYKVFSTISGSLILIAVFILSYKIIVAGMNTSKKNEAKDSLIRLLFGGVFIFLAPLFVRFLLFMNNSLVHLLVSAVNSGTLDASLGNNMLSSIKTGNAITTALVISMFIYLFFKLNIKFIIRQFTIIIFTIFTPIACGLWIINRNVTAAAIWSGQIIMNIFMQFIYCFLFLIYLAFLPSGGGWAISLIWAMMILPLADTLQNCLQNLTSRIAGIDGDQMTGRVMGMGAMLGFGIGAIKEQFKTSNSSMGSNSNTSGFNGFINRAKSIVSPTTHLSNEADYNGNINPIRNVVSKQTKENNLNSTSSELVNKENSLKASNNSKLVARKFVNTGFNATKAYLDLGARMAEGDFSKDSYKLKPNNIKNRLQDTEYIYKTNDIQKLGDNNEVKKQS